MELSFQAWYTIFVVLAMFISLSFTKIRTEVAFLAVMVSARKWLSLPLW